MIAPWKTLLGSLALEDLLNNEVITKQHYDRLWDMFKKRTNQLDYILADLGEIYTGLNDDEIKPIETYIKRNWNITDLYGTKLAF